MYVCLHTLADVRVFTYVSRCTCIRPSSISRNPPANVAHCNTNDATRKLKPRLLNPYFFKNVIKNPKPMNIITCTSWNTVDQNVLKYTCNGKLYIW